MMRLLWLALAVLQAGCAVTPVAPPAADVELAWSEHRASLSGMDRWHLHGRIAIRTEDEGWNASLDWQQQLQSYEIQLTGPLGQGNLQLSGDNGHVVLRSGDDQWEDVDPESLLYRATGWRVPVAALRFWVLGLPAPGPAEQQLDVHGYLDKLQQSDWHIEFRDYARQGTLVLPGRIFVTDRNAQVRLVIDRWDI